MTILFFSRFFYPHIGGVEKHCLEVARRLTAKSHKIIVVTEELPHVSASKKSILKNGIEIYRIPGGREDKFKKFRIWLWLWKNRSLIKKSDIIHCHDVFFWYLPFRFMFLRKPVYTTFHGYESYPISSKAIFIRKISEKLSFGNICIGDFIKKWYGTRPDYVSYGAVESSSLKSQNYNNESAVFIGRLDEQTGILAYVKSIQEIKKRYPKFKLIIVGDGKYRSLIAKKTTLVGFQKNTEKYFYNYHFAFVSRFLSILEAMLAKRLVFAVYDNPLKEDYLKMAPFAKFIIIEKDPTSLAEKVIYYLKHSDEEKKLIDKAYKWASMQTWENMCKIYIQLWHKK